MLSIARHFVLCVEDEILQNSSYFYYLSSVTDIDLVKRSKFEKLSFLS